MIKHLNLMNFEDEIAQGFVLVDYWAPWCQPCLDQNPILEEIAIELNDRVKVYKVDVNDNRVISNKEGVKNIPLLVLYKDAKAIARFQGIQSKEMLMHSILKLI